MPAKVLLLATATALVLIVEYAGLVLCIFGIDRKAYMDMSNILYKYLGLRPSV